MKSRFYIFFALILGAMLLSGCSEEDESEGGGEGVVTIIPGAITKIEYVSYDGDGSIDDEDSCTYDITYDSDSRITKIETSVYKSYDFGVGGDSPVLKYGQRKSEYDYTTDPDKVTVESYESYGDSESVLCDYESDGTSTYNLNSDGYITSSSYDGDSGLADDGQSYTYTNGYLTKHVEYSGSYFNYAWNNGSIVSCSHMQEDSSNNFMQRSMYITYSTIENKANIDLNIIFSDSIWLEDIFSGDIVGKRSTYLVSTSGHEFTYNNGQDVVSCYVKTKNTYTVVDGRVTKAIVYYDELEGSNKDNAPRIDGVYKFTYAD